MNSSEIVSPERSRRECPRCHIEMEEGYTLLDGGHGFRVQIGKQRKFFSRNISKLGVAVCPQCGHVELYKEEGES